jgi:serine/threonine protein kinase
MEDLTGKQFGHYEIVAPLGEGGMAAVYRAYQPSMDRHVAIKVLPRNMASSEEFIARFRREAKLLAQLQHAHILPVFDYGEEGGYPYIVMPFVPSGTLADTLVKKRLTLSQVRRIVTQIGDALSYAHARGMIHRDIKPSNILIDERGNCLLTDFGLARMVEASTKLTFSGAVMGTPAYMSPEQGAGSDIDHRSDIYSLAIILYEMVTGRVPYTAETPVAIVFKHIQDPLPSARNLNPELPDAVEEVLQKALAKSPDNRFQSAEDFVLAIQAAIPDSSPSIKALPPIGSVNTRVPDSPPAPLTAAANIVKPQPVFARYGLAGIVILFVLATGMWGVSSFMAKSDPTQTPTIATTSEDLNIPITAQTETPSWTPTPTSTSEPEILAQISVSRVTLYKGPALEFGLISQIAYSRGTEFIIIGRNLSGLWFLSKAPDGAEGWLYADWLDLSTDPMTIPTASPIPILPPTSRPNPGGGGGGGGDEPPPCGSFCD